MTPRRSGWRRPRRLDWTTPPERALELREPPTFAWFPGGRTNLSVNALDRHVAAGRGDATALIALDERGGRRALTYRELLAEVERVAAGLRGLGIGKGDRLTIYMPTSAEAIVAMLATVRIGAIHCVVFAGFGAGALGDRIRASGSRLVLATDVTYRKGKDVDLLSIVDDALDAGPSDVEHVVVLRRSDATPARRATASWRGTTCSRPVTGSTGAADDTGPRTRRSSSRPRARPRSRSSPSTPMAATASTSPRWATGCSGLRAGETWWSTSDIGWVVGHSYIVYAPLMAGATTIAYEGALDHPDADAPWSIIEREGVTGVFTLADRHPAADALRRGRPATARPEQPRARVLGRRGAQRAGLGVAPADGVRGPRAGHRPHVADRDRRPDLRQPVRLRACCRSSPAPAGVALPGVEADVVDHDGRPVGVGGEGDHAHQAPVPRADRDAVGRARALRRRLLGARSRAATTSATPRTSTRTATSGSPAGPTRSSRSPATGSGRSRSRPRSCAIRPSPRRASPASRTSCAARSSRRSSRCAAGHEPSDELRRELLQTVRHELGPVAVIGHVSFVAMLPKTRSGKIMRRVLKAVALDRDPGDISTIEDEGSVDEARRAVEELRAGLVT